MYLRGVDVDVGTLNVQKNHDGNWMMLACVLCINVYKSGHYLGDEFKNVTKTTCWWVLHVFFETHMC